MIGLVNVCTRNAVQSSHFFLPAPHGIIIVLDRVYNYMYGALPLFLFSLRHMVELVCV